MSTRIVIAATLASVLFGWWLPSLRETAPEKRRRIVPRPSAPGSAWVSLQAKIRHARSPMEQFQAVADGVRGRGAGLAAHLADMGDLGCDDAEGLAAVLAGEELGRHVTDGAAFVKSLRENGDLSVVSAALEAWAGSDPDAALAAMLTPEGLALGTNGSHSGVAEPIIQRLAARDPDKVLAMLKAAPGSYTLRAAWGAVIEACVEKGPDCALAVIKAAPADVRWNGMASLLKRMAAKDPHAALAWRDTLPTELRKVAEPSTIYQIWAETDPQAALADAMKTPDSDAAYSASQVASIWANKDPEAVFEWAATQPDEDLKHKAIEAAVYQLQSRDATRALEMAGHLPAKKRKEKLKQIAYTQAQKDAAAALTWARTLTGEDRATALAGLDPFSDTLPAEDRLALAREFGVGTYDGFDLLWSVDRVEAWKVFADLSAEDQLSAYNSVAGDLDTESPAEAAKLLGIVIRATRAPIAGAGQDGTWRTLSDRVVEVTSAWTGRDPAAAAAWVRQLPEGPSQNLAAENLVHAWGRYDLPAARAWVEQLPPGPARDKAGQRLAALVSASGGDDP